MATTFYKHKKYLGNRTTKYFGDRGVLCEELLIADNIHLFPQELSNEHLMIKNDIFAQFDFMAYEHIGVLFGEYILFPHGLALMDKNGQMIIIGISSDQIFSNRVAEQCEKFVNAGTRIFIMDNWDTIPIVHNVAVVSDRHPENYWHFSMDFIPRFRLFDSYGIDNIVIPSNHIQKKFQEDLIGKTVCKNANFIVVSKTMRVSNPVLSDSSMSEDGLMWLRKKMNISVSSGSKRYYLRRGPSITRGTPGSGIGHGGLAEDDNLLKFLDYFGFQTVECGTGEYSISEQVKMLDGAQIVLGSIGSHMTNILYLNPPVTIIEVFTTGMTNAVNMCVASALSFGYYGIISDVLDSAGNIVPDHEKLYEIVETIISNQKV